MKRKGLLATLAALLVSPIMGHAAGKLMSIGTATNKTNSPSPFWC
jgi:hypothetical protein